MENINDKEKEYNFILDEMNYEIQRSYRSRNKIRLLLRAYVYMGLLLFVIGGFYFGLSFLEFNITSSQRTALLFSGVGLFLSIGAKFYIELIKEREKEQIVRRLEIEKIANFILNWTTFERTLYKLVESKEISNNKFAIGTNLEILLRKGIISNRDYITLEKALDLRNRIVHGRVSTTHEDLNKYSEQLELITDKIIENA